jgi:pyridinium-3,5-biscarboxylic acid mononucleotide sulfurtransferase
MARKKAGYRDLKAFFKRLGGVVVAFSGGVDSSLLLAAAVDALGDRAMAVTFHSPLHSARGLKGAKKIAGFLKAKHRILRSNELALPDVRKNTRRRCYACKRMLYSALKPLAKSQRLSAVVEGSNTDDCRDDRPGMKAVSELGILSPFLSLRLSKSDIRRLAKNRRLPNWNEPSAACLASRIPTGEEITRERISRVERAEKILRDLGVSVMRARDHGGLLRIETTPAWMKRFLQPAFRKIAVLRLLRLGYSFVSLDLLGYRTGSMNPKRKR